MVAKQNSEVQPPWQEAPAHEFLRTEALSGRTSARKVQVLIESMKIVGWTGAPIVAIFINAEKYIIDGHHRVYAARIARIQVLYRVISEADLLQYGYKSTDQVIHSYAQAGPNRIRLRR